MTYVQPGPHAARPVATAARVRQKLYYPADEEKIPLLLGLLSRSEGARTMVFVNTKAFVERVARSLERAGYRVGVLSGDVPQKKRETLLNRFQKGQLEILVATDVAARGLHIDGVSHVFNYDLPDDAEDYVHRIGRTGRNGSTGEALSLLAPEEGGLLRQIQEVLKAPVEMEIVPGFEPSRPVQLNAPIPKQPQRQGRAARPKHATAGKQRKPQGHTAQPRKGGGNTGSRNRRGSGSGFSKS